MANLYDTHATKTSGIFVTTASGRASRLKQVKSHVAYYGVGGGGTYSAGYQLPWRDWDASYNNIDAYKAFYTVGKIDYRLDGPAGSSDCTDPNLQNIYNFEAPIITNMINNLGIIGAVWEVANEPNFLPAFVTSVYVTHYNRYKSLIQGLDPTAKMMIGGVPLSVPWSTWQDATAIIPDIWNIHPYPTSSQNALSTISEIVAFRAHVGGTIPIWLTEFSDTADTNHTYIITYLYKVCNWLNASADFLHIEKWFWWGVHNPSMGENGLFSGGPYGAGTIEDIGAAYYAVKNT